MKKKPVYLILALALAVLLCGCGNDRSEPSATPNTSATASPMITADIEDGVVDDTDGVIGDEGKGTDKKENDANGTDGMNGAEDTETSSAPSSSNKS